MESPEPDFSRAGDDAPGTAPFGDALRSALAFFTRLPIGQLPALPLASCVMAFAPTGALIGLAVGIANLLARGLGLPVLLAALFALAIGIIMTGALHEDGLADTADGLGGHDVAQRLAIMRDSHNGSYGAIALIFSIGLRAACIASLSGGGALWALLGAHALSRGAIAAVLHGLEPARRDGLGASAGRPSLEQAQIAVALGAAILLAAALFSSIAAGLLALVVAGAVGLTVAGLANRRLGGYTGDVLGALQQAIEIAVLMSFALWIGA
jgi:adenosylcobinamide-GDP ribazoletransferase